ncbi:AbrB family transcriptional regulator [Marinobacter halotolerans]|uniref:AbrB family transcriptional regulator n=1 Tax=Marinobacter halotolerans TaxID=1569211 RepID=UPI001248EC08|nr:AbrB family transcriptional regulator [Marinobacter halotolerans]
MKDSPLKCDFPETDLEQQLEKKLYRTHGARLASPPARKVEGVSDSSEKMEHGFAYIGERFMDTRTAFLSLRSGLPAIINLFMIIAMALGWLINLFYSKALLAVLVAFGPVWVAVYLFEIFFPLTLPVRIDRKEGFVYVGHRGTFYRIPWNELEVTFSYNWQYLGSGVVWERQYYCHLFMRDKHYFCGKPPKMPLQRKKISSGFNEERMYQKWNFIVRYFSEGVIEEDLKHLAWINYDSYKEDLRKKPIVVSIIECLGVVLFIPSIIWWEFTPFKFKWPKEIEAIFGKANYY